MDFGPGIALAEAKVQFRNDNGAGEAEVDLSDLTLKAAELRDREMSAGLAGFGYSTLTLSLRMRVTGNYQAGMGALESFEIFGPQVGKLSTSYAAATTGSLALVGAIRWPSFWRPISIEPKSAGRTTG